MKRMLVWITILMIMALTGAAASGTPEECLAQRYPQAQNVHLQQWGDTAAAVLTADGVQLLCVMEKQNGQWALTVDNPDALLQDEALPQLLLDADNALYWYYDDGLQRLSFSAFRGEDGWGQVTQTAQNPLNDGYYEHLVAWSAGGCITHSWERYDANDNPVSPIQSETFAAGWLEDCILLPEFDASRFPVYGFEEYSGQWPARSFLKEGAAYLMPGYTFAGGALDDGNLEFLMDRPDGARVFVGCSFDGAPQLVESTPLPEGAYYGVENFTTSLGIGMRAVGVQRFHNHPWWGVEYLLFDGEDLQLGMNCLFPCGDWSTMYLGYHPWNSLSHIDWNTLPDTLEEAVSQLDSSEWAVVVNPNPADRLHLRERADRKSRSQGKYYSGTPVRVLEVRGDWVEVEVGGQLMGWMMKKYLSIAPDGPIDMTAMPRLWPQENARLYEYCDAYSPTRPLDSASEMLVIGILGDEWYHVWFPLTNDYGFVPQDALRPAAG